MTMRACLVRYGYFPGDPRVRKSALALLELGFDVSVICLQDRAGEVSMWRGITIHRAPFRRSQGTLMAHLCGYVRFLLFATFCITREHLKKRFQLVQVHTLPDFLVFCAIAPKLSGAKVILDLHELSPEFFRAKYGSSLSIPWMILTALERMAIRFANHVMLVAPLQSSILASRSSIDPKRATILPNVPEPSCFRKNIKKNRLLDEREVLTIISHGSVELRYGYHLLVDAVETCLQSNCKVKVLVVGDGSHLETIRRMVIERNLDSYFVFTGWIPLEEVTMLLMEADIGVVPLMVDGYAELMSPNKLFEYVEMGIPVVCSDVPGIRQYFDERCVQYFVPGDPKDLASSLMKVAWSQELRSEMVRSATLVYQAIEWSRWKESYTRVVADLCSSQ